MAQKPKKPEMVEINPGVTAPYKWTIWRTGGGTVVFNATALEVKEGGALVFLDDKNLPLLVIPPSQYAYVERPYAQD